jgi:hypothetical protein
VTAGLTVQRGDAEICALENARSLPNADLPHPSEKYVN